MKSPSSLETLSCTWPVAQALMGADGDDERLCADLRELGAEDPEAHIADAHELGILLTQAQREDAERFYGSWAWGSAARTLMFGYQTDAFAPLPRDEVAESASIETVDLLPRGSGGEITPLPEALPGELNGVLTRRRSRRAFDPRSITGESLAACLRAGFGLTGERTVDGRKLPLTAAPSSGALNTYDACVLARDVAGLSRGVHRYLPQHDHLVREESELPPFDHLFGGQAWAADAACAIVLIADLRRQASKYVFPTTLSAVLIEAGARAELILLQAEELALAAVVVGMAGVGAFDRELASRAGIWGSSSMVVPICAILLGCPAEP